MMSVILNTSDILNFSSAPPPRRRLGSPTTAPRRRPAAVAEVEIRVCVNRSCGRQGSRGILDILSGLAPQGVAVSSCGCLGRCGAGPNLVVLPSGAAIGHCATPARAANLLADLCGPGFDPRVNLDALALRKKGEDELEKGNALEAQALLSQALDLKPSGGLQFLYRSRSAARLAMGNCVGAIEDAEEASKIDPEYPQVLRGVLLARWFFDREAYISQGDAFLAMGEWDAAEKAYSTALLIDPSIRRSKSFKARVTKLQEKLVSANSSS